MSDTLAPQILDRPAGRLGLRGRAVEPQAPAAAVTAETLVEEVSIDGMCGVY